ncbi:MAG: phenylalanine--tRNA ligase subunit alpha [Ignisphaera sp.]|nr:phenylalanine--tRNA ligase subunit alpha [Ignisphaera sp.]MCX8168422.1 phenylalanine--tRNA ligase subunit alpha [Ignisphaera sp.]MDW8086065.1 phenylalanine--tRNA ligase subunit alpha [Ignisphaera sp.]
MEPLSRSEIELLRIIIGVGRPIELSELADRYGIPLPTISSIVELLRSRNILTIEDIERTYATTSDEGLEYATDMLPEEKVVLVLKELGGNASIDKVENILGKERANIGIAWARRRKWIIIEEGNVKLREFRPLEEHHRILRMFTNMCEVPQPLLDNKVFQELVKRKLIIVSKKKSRIVKLAVSVHEALRIIEYGEGISRLTREVIISRLWEKVRIKPYNIEALPPTRYGGKKHFYKEFIEMLKEVMENLGFTEVKDDYVVPELWNFDILFQAQDHPSRDIHDILMVEGSADLSEHVEVVLRARKVHETGGSSGSLGWGYRWSLEKASKLILRSHTTAVTARHLMLHRDPPVRLYTIDRVFRRDNPDARHSPEFTNFDGVVMESNFNFRKLLGLLSQILRYLGISEFKFKPAYFPFTEPSVEGYGYVPRYGWIELFGAGMFRPEVLEILGVKYPVGAWGMGVERLAMVVYGIDDIRLLFSRDIEFIRRFPVMNVRRLGGV